MGSPIRVHFHVLEDFPAGKHLLKSVFFRNDFLPIFSERRILDDLSERLFHDLAREFRSSVSDLPKSITIGDEIC